MQRSELFFPLTLTHTLSLHSEIHYSRDTKCPDALLCFAILCSALQPEYMVMSSSPVLRTRCLTEQLDAYFIHQKVLSGSFFITAISQKGTL